jgi:hypothetical protein
VCVYLNIYIGTNAFNIKKWNAIVFTKKLFPNAKNQALSLGNNLFIAFHFFCVEGILLNMDQNMVTLLKHKGCKKLPSISLASRSNGG